VLGPFAAGAAGEGLGCGAGRARGLSGGDGDLLRPPVPRPGRVSADGLVSASARAVAVQPPAACACPADQPGAAAARPLARRRRCSACRRDADRRRQLPGLRAAERVCRFGPLRPLPVEESLGLGCALGRAQRPSRAAAWLHARRRERARVRGVARFEQRARARQRDRWRQRLLGPCVCGQPPSQRDRAAHSGARAHRRQHCPRAAARLHPTDDRERLREPQRPDAARATPRQNPRRARRPHRPTTARAHPRHPAQHDRRPTSPQPRRLRRPLNHIKPLGFGRRGTRAAEVASAPVQTLRRTPLHDRHVALGARMVPFAGWEMPVQYEGVIQEHRAVREDAGAFDVSHMGELEVEGPRARELLQGSLSNDLERIEPGAAQYTLLTNETGGIVDDLIAYELEPFRFLLIVNASNRETDFTWLKEREAPGSDVRDVSDDYGLIAVQGPRALERLDLPEAPAFTFAEGEVAGVPCMVNRTGYTGEEGVELLASAEDAG